MAVTRPLHDPSVKVALLYQHSLLVPRDFDPVIFLVDDMCVAIVRKFDVTRNKPYTDLLDPDHKQVCSALGRDVSSGEWAHSRSSVKRPSPWISSSCQRVASIGFFGVQRSRIVTCTSNHGHPSPLATHVPSRTPRRAR